MNYSPRLLLACFAILSLAVAARELLVVDDKSYHLRSGETREWTEFAARPDSDALTLTFQATANDTEQTLLLRHRDVRQRWSVRLNGKELGRLLTDENDITSYWPIGPGGLRDGENKLEIRGSGKQSDDIEVGRIRIASQSPGELLAQCQVSVTVIDAASGMPLPCRLTIVDSRGSLAPIGAKSDGHLAVRPGVIYTCDGLAEFGLPAGKYTIYAGRGFEYSVAQTEVELTAGSETARDLRISREVQTPGLISVDTHIHTVTYSGHGDARIDERMATIAGEGIELAVATDHNVHVDYEPVARETGTRNYFTPVIGNEVTTPVGHFNAFPIQPQAPVAPFKVQDWTSLLPAVRNTPGVSVVILNHPRNVHGGFQPFGARHFNSASGQLLDGWELQVDGIEVLTSAALQSDLELLYRDWFALLNRGVRLAPIGACDSHDVNRYILGQGRTYVACPDDDPAKVNVESACRGIRAGRVLVSMGLLVDLRVAGKFAPGDTVPALDNLELTWTVQGPSWVRAEQFALYVNGIRLEGVGGKLSVEPAANRRGGLQARGTYVLPQPKHDVYLVAIATGPGVSEPYWRIPKPYQAASPNWNSLVLGSTGAIWLDADGDGKFTSPYAYAQRLVAASGGDHGKLFAALGKYDRSVATQAASLWQAAGHDLLDAQFQADLKQSAEQVRQGFNAYVQAWRASEAARSE